MAEKQKTEQVVQWHPPFYAAMELDLMEDEAMFQYHREYHLGFKPNMIDLLVIKRDRKTAVHSSLARFFKKCNLVEYKSPDDRLNMKIVYRSIGYAFLYLCYAADTDDPDEVTLTFVRDIKPRKLFAELDKRGFYIIRDTEGIYHVTKHNWINMQFVVTRELDREKYRWLTKLSRHLSVEEMIDAAHDQAKLDEAHWMKADAVIHLMQQVNTGVVKEARQMTFDEIRAYFREEALREKAEKERYEAEKAMREEEMRKQEEEMRKQEEEMRKREEEIAKQNDEIAKQSDEIAKQNDELKEKEATIQRLKKEIQQLQSKIAAL